MMMDMEYFKHWVLKEFNIDLSAYKPNQLHRRINSLMSRVGVESIEEYISLLKADRGQRQRFLDFITINVSVVF
jgi:Methylase of chemotaxis methyl-accepting proteins